MLLLFDLEANGHHASFLYYLARHWQGDEPLHAVVSAEWRTLPPDLASLTNVEWHPISESEQAAYEQSKRSLLRHTIVEWRLFFRYAKRLRARHSLIMMIDRFQLPLALGLRAPCTLAGIYFRPKSHLPPEHPSLKTTLTHQRERLLWRRALQHPQLKTLFSLDPFAVPHLQALSDSAAVVALPDPVEMLPPNEQTVTRERFGIDPERNVLLLFGQIDSRKGIFVLLDALEQLSEAEQQQTTLLLVGSIVSAEKSQIQQRIQAVRKTTTVQIVVHDTFIPQAEISGFMQLADGVLLLYQAVHVGSSGVLLWAAAFEKPVLATEHGLIGRHVRSRQLGLTVDSASASAVANGLQAMLEEQIVFDPAAARQFAAENSAQNYAQTLYAELTKRCQVSGNRQQGESGRVYKQVVAPSSDDRR